MTRPEQIQPSTSIAGPFLGELVDTGQALELSAIGANIAHEVDRPDLIGADRRLRPRPARADALAWPPARELQAARRHSRQARPALIA